MLSMKSDYIFPPIKTGYGDGTGRITDKHRDFYFRRSQFLGAITLEPLYLHKSLRELPPQIGIDSDDKLEGLSVLNGQLHEQGTKVIAHLNHPGRMANPKIPGNIFLSSTDKPCENGGATPSRMKEQDMKSVIAMFIDAARRAEKANFDALELQFGHGYLLAQFLSPLVNDRTDGYGGSFENRARFPLEVLKRVISAVSLPIIARISGDEMIPGGLTLEEMIPFSKLLVDNGVCALHVSAGTLCSSPPWFFQHMFVPKGKTWELAGSIQREVHIPVIFVGRINSIDDVNKLKKEYNATYFAVGRAVVADPDFIGKIEGRVAGQVRPCLACAEGCRGGIKAGKGLQCMVNPLVGHDSDSIALAREKKRFAIVGGGLAGMEAALTLDRKGHSVRLFEKNELGGQFNLASLPPHKESMKRLVDFYKKEIVERSISVIHKEAGPDDVLSGHYDGVVLATGSVPAIPAIEGLHEYYWAEVLEDHNLPEAKNALIIGGGLIGIEVAHKLVQRNNRVYIVEMLEDVGRGMEMISQKLTMKSLREHDVQILTKTVVTKIEGKSVFVDGETHTQFDDIDIIILAAGMVPFNPLEKLIADQIPVHVIGDAYAVGKAQDAIASARFTTQNL